MAEDTFTVDSRLSDLMPEGHIPCGFVASIRTMDEDGVSRLTHVRSAEIPTWEALGMLISHTDDLREQLKTAPDPDEAP